MTSWVKILCLIPFFFGCMQTHRDLTLSSGGNPAIPADYENLIQTYSVTGSHYVGLYNNFRFHATLITPPIRRAINDRLESFYKKLPETAVSESKKDQNQTQLFLSFYTPERRNDNLDQKSSIWTVFLIFSEKKIAGSIKKDRRNLSELQALYPYHNRWTTAYMVEFPIPNSKAHEATALQISGPLGKELTAFPKP